MRPILIVDRDLCRGCQHCRARAVCRPSAIRQFEAGGLPIIDIELCRGCRLCVAACASGAIRSEQARRDEG